MGVEFDIRPEAAAGVAVRRRPSRTLVQTKLYVDPADSSAEQVVKGRLRLCHPYSAVRDMKGRHKHEKPGSTPPANHGE
jgi:hypothetical protein